MWLLTKQVAEQISKARESGRVFTQAEIDSIEAAEKNNSPRLQNKVNIVPIEGVLSRKRDFFAAFFGGGNTLYSDITSAIEQGEANPRVKEHYLNVGSSPGGEVDGLFGVLDAISGAKKPVTAFVEGMAASATMGIVSQADKIVAANDVTQFGSVGVASSYYVSDKVVDITSTEAPDKRPDVSTDEGKATVRNVLDAIHEKFAGAIARGRGTTLENVNKNFGRGAIVIASDAIKRGMIDQIGSAESKPQNTAKSGGKVKSMDLKELKAAHPDVYAEAVQIGVAQGVAQERDRVTAHATLGKSSGDMETALTAIEEGEKLTQTLQAKYLASMMNKRDIDARQEANEPDLESGTTGDEKLDATGKALQLLAGQNNDGDTYDIDDEEAFE